MFLQQSKYSKSVHKKIVIIFLLLLNYTHRTRLVASTAKAKKSSKEANFTTKMSHYLNLLRFLCFL